MERRAFRRIGGVHVIDFRIVDRETTTHGLELRHDQANDVRDHGIVLLFNKTQLQSGSVLLLSH